MIEPTRGVTFSPDDLARIQSFKERYGPYGFRFAVCLDHEALPEVGEIHFPSVAAFNSPWSPPTPAFLLYRADPTCIVLAGADNGWQEEEPFDDMAEALAAVADMIAEISLRPLD